MYRRDEIQMLYDKPRIVGFQFDKLWHPPMSYYISQQDVLEIYNISKSAKLNALPMKKYSMVDEILKRRGFTRLHAGTNRLVYKSEYDSTICLKIGIDIVGREANVGEYYTQEILKPFCTKVFEVTPCGTVAMVERVNPIKNRYQFEDVGDIIFNIIIMQFAGIVLEDVGTNFFMNWGIREGFGPVVLDFPYAYEADIRKLHCIQKDKLGVQCDGLIDYDDGLNNIICNKCGTRYTARELRKYYSSKHKVQEVKNEKGEIRMPFNVILKKLDPNTGEYKVYGNPFDSHKKFKNNNGKRVYPSPPKPFEGSGFVSKVIRPQKTSMEEAFEEAVINKSYEEIIDVEKIVDAANGLVKNKNIRQRRGEAFINQLNEKLDMADKYIKQAEEDNDLEKAQYFTSVKENLQNHYNLLESVMKADYNDNTKEIYGEVEVQQEEEQNDVIDNEISEVEAQTPLTTYVSANPRNYVPPQEEDDNEEEDDDILNISDDQKKDVDKAYEEIIDEALREVNDPDMLTNKEVSKCVRICCAHIVKNCKNINKKDIKDYIRLRVINDSIMHSKNIDNF